MKNIKLIFALLAIVLLVPSCEDDGGKSKMDFGIGAVPNITKVPTLDGFIDLVKLNEGKTITIGSTINLAQGDVVSMDIVGFYKKGTAVYKATLKPNVTTFPTTLTFTQNDLITAFAELNSVSDFALGDQFTVTAILTLKDGSSIKIINDNGTANYGQDIANSTEYKVLQTYNVSCPSALAGTYSVLSSGASTDSGPSPSENPISNYPYTTVITADGGGSYTMSDAFGGLEILWYDIYGLTFPVKGKFKDVCGTLSGSFTGAFGESNTITGTVNPNGTLTIHWENEWADYGDSVYTKK